MGVKSPDQQKGKPLKTRMDNGPGLIAKTSSTWSEMQQIVFNYI